MSDFKSKVEESASFYTTDILNFDYQLCYYNYLSFKPFFKGKKALELGPASGYMTKYLANDFDELVLVEGAKDLYDLIPAYPNVKKYNAFFEEFSTEEKFDTIIMGHVLEHIKEPVSLLRSIKPWLAEDGIFLISVPNAKSIHRIVAEKMGYLESIYSLNERDKQLGHYRVYDLNSLQKDAEEAGLAIIETGGVFLKPLANAQIQETWSEQMIQGFYETGKLFKENCAEIFVVCKNLS